MDNSKTTKKVNGKAPLTTVPLKRFQHNRGQAQLFQLGWPMFRTILTTLLKVIYFVMVYYSYLWLFTNHMETIKDIFSSVGEADFATLYDKFKVLLGVYKAPQCEGGYVHDGSYEFKDEECYTPLSSL